MCTRQRELAQSRVWLPRGMLAVARVPASLTCSWRRLEAFLRRFSSLMCCSTSRTDLRVEMNMSPHRLTARLAFFSSDLVVCPPLYLSGSTQGHTGHDTHNDAGFADTRGLKIDLCNCTPDVKSGPGSFQQGTMKQLIHAKHWCNKNVRDKASYPALHNHLVSHCIPTWPPGVCLLLALEA